MRTSLSAADSESSATTAAPSQRTYRTKHGTVSTMDVTGQQEAAQARATPPAPPPPAAPLNAAGDEQLREAQDAIQSLAAENERLTERLAVEAMDASEDEKTAAAELIAELKARVAQLEIEADALKASRDSFMRENAELKRQVRTWRTKAEKAEQATP